MSSFEMLFVEKLKSKMHAALINSALGPIIEVLLICFVLDEFITEPVVSSRGLMRYYHRNSARKSRMVFITENIGIYDFKLKHAIIFGLYPTVVIIAQNLSDIGSLQDCIQMPGLSCSIQRLQD